MSFGQRKRFSPFTEPQGSVNVANLFRNSPTYMLKACPPRNCVQNPNFLTINSQKADLPGTPSLKVSILCDFVATWLNCLSVQTSLSVRSPNSPGGLSEFDYLTSSMLFEVGLLHSISLQKPYYAPKVLRRNRDFVCRLRRYTFVREYGLIVFTRTLLENTGFTVYFSCSFDQSSSPLLILRITDWRRACLVALDFNFFAMALITCLAWTKGNFNFRGRATPAFANKLLAIYSLPCFVKCRVARPRLNA